jgi:hypothetical protein
MGMVLLGVGVLGTGGEAGELGHYAPALFNIRDFIMPAQGVYGALYGAYYIPNDFRNRHGDEVDAVTIRGRRLALDVDLDLYSIAPAVLWNTGWKVIGADYGMIGTLPFGSPERAGSRVTGA